MWPYIAIGLAVVAGIIFHDLRSAMSVASHNSKGLQNSLSSLNFSVSGKHGKAWDVLFYVIMVALILMAGLRYRIGMDTIVLQSVADTVPDLKDLSLEDLSRDNHGRFIPIYSLLKAIGVGFWPWFLLCALLHNGLFAVCVARYTPYRFTAIGFYLAYSYLTLNFETMLAGVAAGALLWAIPDLYERKVGRFYLKLASGAIFHLSILLLFWLPALGSRRVRNILTDWKWIAVLAPLGIMAGIAVRLTFPFLIRICDHMPLLPSLGFSGSCALPYADLMLAPENLNWKGYAGVGFRTVIVPLLAAWLLMRGNRSSATLQSSEATLQSPATVNFIPDYVSRCHERYDSGNFNLFMASLLVVIALLEVVRFEVTGFSRITLLLWPIGCIALSRTLGFVKGYREIGIWSMASLSALFLCVKGFATPIELTGEQSRLELYIPYADCISKGVCYRREWLAYEHIRKKLNNDYEVDPVYDFGFELQPGQHEIASVFHPDCFHEHMERIRLQKSGSDSIAPVIPMKL